MTRPRRFRWGFALLGVLLVGLIVWLVLGRREPAKAEKSPMVPVNVAEVQVQDAPLTVTALGAAQAWRGVTISPQVGGRLTYVAAEGADVAAGQRLAEIDAAPYRAALTQAQGVLMRDQALLQNARLDLARYQALAAQDSISRQQVDSQAALVKQDEGIVLADQGAVDAAKVNVGYCRILSPISGRVGVRLIDPGNVVSASSASGIVTVNEVTPIAVTFTVPQGDFQRLSDASGAFTRPLAVEALDQDGGASLGSGVLAAADNHVDASTATVELKARFANADRRLWPGQFVNVRLTLAVLRRAVVAPTAAINEGPGGSYVYVVGAGGVAVMRPVKVQAVQDGTAILASGLSPGERVVTDGQMTLRNGSKVAVRGARPAGKPAA
jgi:multidrug efflux system membrane fusion protein